MDVPLPPPEYSGKPTASPQPNSTTTKPGASTAPPPGKSDSPPSWPPPRHFATQYDLEAATVDEMHLPTVLSRIVGKSLVSPGGAMKYVENQFKAAVQKSDDPIERWVIQQILLLHHSLIQSHYFAGGADSLEGIKIHTASTARLTAEFRRMVLTLHQYRAPYAGKSIAFIKQQNVAQTQDVQLNQGKRSKKKKLAKRSELEDAKPTGVHYDDRFGDLAEEPGPGGSREKTAALER